MNSDRLFVQNKCFTAKSLKRQMRATAPPETDILRGGHLRLILPLVGRPKMVAMSVILLLF